MVEYVLADRLGRAWLGLRKSLRPRLGELPGRCALVARGNALAAGQLWQAQDFAVRAWWRLGMVAVLLIFPVIGIGAALRPGRIGTDVGTGLIFGLILVAGVAMAQMGMLRYRADRTRLYLRKAAPQATVQPLPLGAQGLPRRSDFWVVLIVAVVVLAVLSSAGTR